MVSTGLKKVMQTADQLWQTFVDANADLGPGSSNARGTIPLHPIDHWQDDEAVEYYAKKAFDLEALQIMRTKNWLDQGLRKDGVDEYWVLERVIAAAMEYTVSDFEHLMRVFFIEWEKELKPDGRTNKNKDQWTRWCEVHLVRHHRNTKAIRCLEVLEALGLLFPGWWKQVYALKHNTPVVNETYASPWDIRPSADVAKMDELNQKYARVPHSTQAQAQAATRAAASTVDTPAKLALTYGKKGKGRKRTKITPKAGPQTTTKTSRFHEHLEELDNEYADSAPAKDPDNESEESFRPEDYYPDYVHEYDAVMGTPKTTNPELAHTVGFAPAADAWRDLNRNGFEGATRFNPEINATRIVDSVAEDAVPSRPVPHADERPFPSVPRTNTGTTPGVNAAYAPRGTAGSAPSAARTSDGPVPYASQGPVPSASHGTTGPAPRVKKSNLYIPMPQPLPRPEPARPQPSFSPFGSINWADLDERDFARAVNQVESDFPHGGHANNSTGPQRMSTHQNAIYNAVAGYRGVSAADLARRNAERQAESAGGSQAPQAAPEAAVEPQAPAGPKLTLKDIGWEVTNPDPAMYPPED